METEVDRKVDLVFVRSYNDIDDCVIEIPEGYKIESLPQEISIQSAFGNYFAAVKLEGNKIIYHRRMEKFSGRFPPSLQPELTRFLSDIYKADRNKVVLVRKA